MHTCKLCRLCCLQIIRCVTISRKKIPKFFYLLYTYKLLLFPEMLEAAEDPEVFEMTVAGLAI